jgi:hypothetical protein
MAKERVPSKSQLSKISTKFRRIIDGKVELFEEKDLRAWYGIYNDKAVDKLKDTWETIYANSGKASDWVAPKITVVRVDRPKGYALGLQSSRKDWTWSFGT